MSIEKKIIPSSAESSITRLMWKREKLRKELSNIEVELNNRIKIRR